MTRESLYWQFDDTNPVFKYGPGWSNASDTNAHDFTLSYTSQKTNVTIEFYGKSMWLYGVIGKTEDLNQPVYRYTLDSKVVSTVVASPKNETSYNELLAHLYGLDPSYHTLLVENINEDAVLYMDYYLVEPVPPTEVAKSMVTLPTGGETLTTSISEDPMAKMTADSSANSLVGLILGVVVGVLGAIFIAIAMFLLCRRRRNAKPYYYQSTTVYDVLSDELESHKHEPKRDLEPEAPEAEDAANPSYPSSIYSLNSGRASTHSLTSRPSYFPMPSELRSKSLLAKSNSIRSQSSTLSGSTSGRQSPRNSLSSQERRPLL